MNLMIFLPKLIEGVTADWKKTGSAKDYLNVTDGEKTVRVVLTMETMEKNEQR